MGHSQEDLGCIHHIAGEDSLAEGSHRRSWMRRKVSQDTSSTHSLSLSLRRDLHVDTLYKHRRGQRDRAPLLRILRTLVIVTLACHCDICTVARARMRCDDLEKC